MRVPLWVLAAAVIAVPLLSSGAEARSVTANQLSAWGHGREPTLTNRPSWDIYRRNRYDGSRLRPQPYRDNRRRPRSY